MNDESTQSRVAELEAELLNLRNEVREAVVGDAAFGRVVELLFYEPLREAESSNRELRYALWQIAVALDLDPASTPRVTLVNAVKRAVEAKPESTEPKQ